MRALLNHDSDMPVIRDAPLVLNACGSGRLLPDSGSVGFSGSMLLPVNQDWRRKHKSPVADASAYEPKWQSAMLKNQNKFDLKHTDPHNGLASECKFSKPSCSCMKLKRDPFHASGAGLLRSEYEIPADRC